jgi:hypothetical protein
VDKIKKKPLPESRNLYLFYRPSAVGRERERGETRPLYVGASEDVWGLGEHI